MNLNCSSNYYNTSNHYSTDEYRKRLVQGINDLNKRRKVIERKRKKRKKFFMATSKPGFEVKIDPPKLLEDFSFPKRPMT